jgi:chemotaxis protein CheZ
MMKEDFKEKISVIVNGKLSPTQLDELIDFFKIALDVTMDQEDESFFKKLAFEMTGSVKELALLIINFRRSLKSKIQPEIMDLAEKHIPHAADQLEGIIETTEKAANKIMDNLDIMQEDTGKLANTFSALKSGILKVPGSKNGEMKMDDATIKTLSPLLDYVEFNIRNHLNLISDTFVQMSFQDLTGQRIKKIMGLVYQMEEKLRKMVVSFGFKLSEKKKNPHISEEELQRMVVAKESELSGPQKEGQGLDQAGIDELLANL